MDVEVSVAACVSSCISVKLFMVWRTRVWHRHIRCSWLPLTSWRILRNAFVACVCKTARWSIGSIQHILIMPWVKHVHVSYGSSTLYSCQVALSILGPQIRFGRLQRLLLSCAISQGVNGILILGRWAMVDRLNNVLWLSIVLSCLKVWAWLIEHDIECFTSSWLATHVNCVVILEIAHFWLQVCIILYSSYSSIKRIFSVSIQVLVNLGFYRVCPHSVPGSSGVGPAVAVWTLWGSILTRPPGWVLQFLLLLLNFVSDGFLGLSL